MNNLLNFIRHHRTLLFCGVFILVTYRVNANPKKAHKISKTVSNHWVVAHVDSFPNSKGMVRVMFLNAQRIYWLNTDTGKADWQLLNASVGSHQALNIVRKSENSDEILFITKLPHRSIK